MNVYENGNILDILKNNTYPGRGIIIGTSADGQYAVTAYFIMGRSENSRNRVFVPEENAVTIYPFDESKVTDPSLIIYSPLRRYENKLIITNGDQTDTVYDGLKEGKTFAHSLKSREFEPDAPNFTPRISGMLTFDNGGFEYEMSILKSADEQGNACNRYHFEYSPIAGVGHFIHTYNCDGNPIPTFTGEPERIAIGNDDINSFAVALWENLNPNNKVSLLVNYTKLEDNSEKTVIINRHVK